MRRLGTIVFVVLVAALAVSALAHVAWYFPRTVDDMFIYLRFAENFASGHGLVYNPGERVEGFSSLPWVLLQSLAFLTGLDAVTFTKVLGILSLGALLYAAALIVLDMTGSRVLAVLCALLLSLNGYLVFWAVTGLETPLFLAALLWTVVASTRYEQAPGFRRGAGFVLAAFFLSVARPEGPLYVAAIVAAAALSRGGGLRPSEKLKYVAAIALAAGTLYLLVVIARFLYYGEIVPHTYYAKATAAPSLLHLSPLVTQGATVAEAVFILLGLFLTVMLSLTRGSGALAAPAVACLLFVVLVDEDWMPSMRFFLPLYVVLVPAWMFPLGWIVKTAARRPAASLLAVPVLAFLGVLAWDTGSVETRLMPAEIGTYGDGTTWRLRKDRASLEAALMALRRRTPPDVLGSSIERLGMTHQLFDAIEASAAPLEQSWYVGRDIGKVGFLAPVKVFDTDGLFTPALAQDPRWRRDRTVSAALVEKAFAHHPVACELMGNWGPAAMRGASIMKGYDVSHATDGIARNMFPKDRALPPSSLVLERYEKARQKLPSLYFVLSLHGESIGAIVERRAAYVRQVIKDHDPLTVTTPAGSPVGQASFPAAGVASYGCTVSPAGQKRGGPLTVTCYFGKSGLAKGLPKIFMHFEGPGRFQGDHLPVGGLVPPPFWPEGIVRDVHRMIVPASVPPGPYTLFFGLFTWTGRLPVQPESASAGNDRVRGPTVTVL